MDGASEPVRPGPSGGLSFVNVTFPGELPLLRLQARSMGLYLPDAVVDEILNIANATDEAAALADLEAIRADYGPLAPKVRNVTASEVFAAGPGRVRLAHWPKRLLSENPWIYGRHRPGWRGNDGWQMQQALKLGAARLVKTPVYVILDSKNIFLAPITAADFLSPSGRPLARLNHGRGRVDWLGASIRALGLDPDLAARRPILSFLTPAVFERVLIERVLAEVEARHGTVQALFAMPGNKATEFMLVSGWCLKDPGGVLGHFEEELMDPFNLNYKHTEEFRLQRAREAVQTSGKLITPHRAVMTSVSADLRGLLVSLLSDRCIVAGEEAFAAVIEDIRRRNPELPRQ
jgi:hypothetical protein